MKKVNFVTPELRVVLARYYKGTSLDGLPKQLEEYLDDKQVDNESQIHFSIKRRFL